MKHVMFVFMVSGPTKTDKLFITEATRQLVGQALKKVNDEPGSGISCEWQVMNYTELS